MIISFNSKLDLAASLLSIIDAGLVSDIDLSDISSASIATIPSAIQRLPYLSSLVLSNASIGGKLPPELFLLGSLARLDVSNNQISGSIPHTIG